MNNNFIKDKANYLKDYCNMNRLNKEGCNTCIFFKNTANEITNCSIGKPFTWDFDLEEKVLEEVAVPCTVDNKYVDDKYIKRKAEALKVLEKKGIMDLLKKLSCERKLDLENETTIVFEFENRLAKESIIVDTGNFMIECLDHSDNPGYVCIPELYVMYQIADALDYFDDFKIENGLQFKV